MKKRTRVSRPYPQHQLEEVLGIARAIKENNAGLPYDRVRLAKSIGTTPASSAFMMKLNSSAKYGLTDGGYKDARISLTPLGIVATGVESDDNHRSLIKAAMQPEVFKSFYELLGGKRIPNEEEAVAIIADDLGVPESLASECFSIVVANGAFVGIVAEVGGSKYVSLAELPAVSTESDYERSRTLPSISTPEVPQVAPSASESTNYDASIVELSSHSSKGRLFIAHSGAIQMVNSIVAMLDDFSIPYDAVDVHQSDDTPLSPDASAAMDACSGAIIVFSSPDQDQPDSQLALSGNYKMLLQLGAALDRFRERVVTVVGPAVDQDLQIDGVRSIRLEATVSDSSELELLRELHQAGTVTVSVPQLS